MREIKFRAWGKQNSEMIPSTDVAIMPIGEGVSPLVISGEAIRIRPDNEDYIIMQFTGLLDRHGVEIYEGDIVKVPLRKDHDVISTGVVEIDPLNLLIKIGGYGNYILEYFTFEEFLYQRAEIIGNIYRNPELLKEDI